MAEGIMRRTSKPFYAGSNPVSCTKNEEWCKVHGRSLKPYSLLRAAAWVRFPTPQPKFSMIKTDIHHLGFRIKVVQEALNLLEVVQYHQPQPFDVSG